MAMIQNLEAVTFQNIQSFHDGSCKNLHPTPKLDNYPCQLSMAAFQYFLRNVVSIYSKHITLAAPDFMYLVFLVI
jgi:hypothetical protein